ncbi:MAG: metallophosphoesterase [Deltaproteobacteria bacterium]|nr:metallophosphoesterase [Deltaproteobacteria bacterium]
MKISRRDVLTAGVFGGLATLGASGVLRADDDTNDFQLVELNVPIKDLPSAFEGYRIGFLTDTHLGIYVPTDWIDQSVGMLKAAGVDLLILGGDYIWLPDRDAAEKFYPIRNRRFLRAKDDMGVSREIFATMADVSAQLQPRDGSFGVLGNHDHWTNPAACVEEFGKKDIRILVNEKILISRGEQTLTVIGVDDYWTGIPKMPQLSDRGAGKEARVLISHNPDYVSELLRTGLPDLDFSLSGHTHGGQVKWPLIGALHYNIEDLRFREGFYRDKGLTSYTSRGIGVVEVPFRLNCPPEISLFTLTRA